jgi:magnesium chelatase family protein
MSGPLLDRFDLTIEVPAVHARDLLLPSPSEGSRDVAARVARARAIQRQRFLDIGLPDLVTNSAASAAVVEQMARPDKAGTDLIREAADRMRLTARGFHRVLKLARTLADLDESDGVRRIHIAEALSYRRQSAAAAQAA